ncbi:MAG: 2-phosphosulfolactate phosphatase [Planctomycetota bacterium]
MVRPAQGRPGGTLTVPRIDVAVLPDAMGDGPYPTAIVVDVLRATTTIASMLDAGAEAVIPVGDVSEARAIKEAFPEVMLAGERGGIAPAGFDLGNSPLPERVAPTRGKAVVMTTTNGTRAVTHAATRAGGVISMSFTNIRAVEAHLNRADADAVIVCAGTDGARSREDEFAAGILVFDLQRTGGWDLSERALAAMDASTDLLMDAQGIDNAVRSSPHAKRLAAIGFAEDVACCSEVDTTAMVPRLRDADDAAVARGMARFVAS